MCRISSTPNARDCDYESAEEKRVHKIRILANDEIYKITVTGLLRSVELLEDFVLECVDSSLLATNRERDFLNRVKERKNTRNNPIGVYLRPDDEPPYG